MHPTKSSDLTETMTFTYQNKLIDWIRDATADLVHFDEIGMVFILLLLLVFVYVHSYVTICFGFLRWWCELSSGHVRFRACALRYTCLCVSEQQSSSSLFTCIAFVLTWFFSFVQTFILLLCSGRCKPIERNKEQKSGNKEKAKCRLG